MLLEDRWRKMQETFISDEEREKCRRVAEAFREALEGRTW